MNFLQKAENEIEFQQKIIQEAEKEQQEFIKKQREKQVNSLQKRRQVLLKRKKAGEELEEIEKEIEFLSREVEEIEELKGEEEEEEEGEFLEDNLIETERYEDDGNEESYQSRLSRLGLSGEGGRGSRSTAGRVPSTRSAISEEGESIVNGGVEGAGSGDMDEFHEMGNGFKVPINIYRHLFGYQKTCIKWLWELHRLRVGGVVGDEMGLGKTVQIVAYLASLHKTRGLKGPCLIVCPATVLKQWVQEFHKWFPFFRVAILHSTGSYFGGQSTTVFADSDTESEAETEEDEEEDDEEVDIVNTGDSEDDYVLESTPKVSKTRKKPKNRKEKHRKKIKTSDSRPMSSKVAELVNFIRKQGHIIVTTYSSLSAFRRYLLPVKWSYCILDEGHKIRNPDAQITLICKQLRTVHRIILTGTPIQNNLQELWSLYDFVYPGRLGTLPVFKTQFEIPIRIGGYTNATAVQVQTAYQCASILKDYINPYMLRRMKIDVAQQLPKKVEQVLFCKLSSLQRRLYMNYLDSDDVKRIFAGNQHVLAGIDTLKKICNHPDLVRKPVELSLGSIGGPNQKELEEAMDEMNDKYELEDEVSSKKSLQKSGKMVVLFEMLKIWKSEGHRCLVFCQTRQMLNIIEKYVKNMYSYYRMDGNTPIQLRSKLVDTFNTSSDVFIFLLTTKVGGLGINLTGANRVVIYDPDWNPSTDAQARERCWRVGQKKDVAVYRLIASGTIEEKIYQRQIYKQFLQNKVLKDARQRRIFKSDDLHSLFQLADETDEKTETSHLFKDYNAQVAPSVLKSTEYKQENESLNEDDRIMSALLSKGVSALHHEKIVNSSQKDAKLMNREATLVAKEAAEELKKSRLELKGLAVGQPTWTGKFGFAGASGGKSEGLLKGLKERQGVSEKKVLDSSGLMQELRNFLANKDLVESNVIMEAFPRQDVAVMREMLREIAVLEYQGNRKGWRLKEEYR